MSWWLLVLACAVPEADNPFERDDDGDGWSEFEGDCNDADATVGPALGESCDDQDGDFFFAARAGGLDCNDNDPFIHPFATEDDSNRIDEDCDGLAPEDLDGDGFRSISTGGSDCDDGDPDVSPAASEDYTDAVDSDCNGIAELDLDDDGYISEETGGDDCDDDDAEVNPGATEDATDDIDNDCDGEAPIDLDGDGYLSADAGGDDCDDTDSAVNPGAEEICGNGIDDDCEPVHTCELQAEEDLTAADFDLEGAETDQALGQELLTADFDGDGSVDLFITGEQSAWLMAGPFTAGSTSVPRTATWTIERPTLAVLAGEALLAAVDGVVYLWQDPITTEPVSTGADLALKMDSAMTPSALLAMDLDGDGTQEILAAESDQAALVAWWTDSTTAAEPDERWHLGEGGGSSLAAEDVDGDGYADLLIGTPLDDTNGTDAGAVFVFSGPVTAGLDSSSCTWLGGAGDMLGEGRTLTGEDLSGDGDEDLLLSAPSSGNGMSWVVSEALTGVQEVRLQATGVRYGITNESGFGNALAIDDVDGDGQADLLGGSPTGNWGGSSSGAVALFLGPLTGSVGSASADVVLEFASADARMGTSVGLEDLDGDGLLELLGGAPGATAASRSSAGRVAAVSQGPGE